MKIKQIFILVVFLYGCCQETTVLKNDLTKAARKITETSFSVHYDSLDVQSIDTLSTIEKYFNDNNQIAKRIDNLLSIKETMEIDFFYDDSDRLEQEIVKLSLDTLVVKYFYKDSLLLKSETKSTNSEFKFEQNTTYKYSDGKIIEELTTQIYLDIESKDTLKNTIEVNKYNKDEYLKESQLINVIYPERNKKISYNYKCNRLVRTVDYDDNDSLISVSHYEYELDEFENWIEMRTIEADRLIRFSVRKIGYK